MSRNFSELDLETFFTMMGATLKQRGNGNFITSCVFGHNHASGKDKHPSLSVGFNGITSGWKCFGGCNDSGTIRKLANKWLSENGDSRPLEFIRGFDDNKKYGDHQRGTWWKERAKTVARSVRRNHKQIKLIDEDGLKNFMDRVPEYAFERGLTKRQIIDWEIGYDEKQDRMIIPIRNQHSKLFGVSGRDISGDSEIKYRHYAGFRKDAVLYGEKFINIKNQKAFLVEGFSDVWALQRHGLENVLGTMGTSISTTQEQTLFRWFKQIVFLPDGDAAGLKFSIEAGYKLLMRKIKIGIAGVEKNKEYVRRQRRAKWESKDYQYTFLPFMVGKDPDQLTKEEVDLAIGSTQWLSFLD